MTKTVRDQVYPQHVRRGIGTIRFMHHVFPLKSEKIWLLPYVYGPGGHIYDDYRFLKEEGTPSYQDLLFGLLEDLASRNLKAVSKSPRRRRKRSGWKAVNDPQTPTPFPSSSAAGGSSTIKVSPHNDVAANKHSHGQDSQVVSHEHSPRYGSTNSTDEIGRRGTQGTVDKGKRKAAPDAPCGEQDERPNEHPVTPPAAKRSKRSKRSKHSQDSRSHLQTGAADCPEATLLPFSSDAGPV